VFVPAYNCSGQINRVLDQLTQPSVQEVIHQVIVVNNRSTDDTPAVVRRRICARNDKFIKLITNDDNYGLGGSHKVAFQYAIQHGFDWVVVLHGDDQGAILDFEKYINSPIECCFDAILGSRFMRGSQVKGYSKIRLLGNYVFNIIYSICLGKKISDLGAGLNMYRTKNLNINEILCFPDNLTFNCVMLCSQIINKQKIKFSPITWREDDQVSNVKLIRQAFQTLLIALSASLIRLGLLRGWKCCLNARKYTWKIDDE
jgi:glycosyltransferase involved in cell wall biosynthesis